MMRGLFILIIFPVCFLMFNNAAYRHQHVLSNGQVIEHAHPFQSNTSGEKSSSGHQHTKSEILQYSIISDSSIVVVLLPQLLAVYRTRESDLKAANPRKDFSNAPALIKLLRAPPCFV